MSIEQLKAIFREQVAASQQSGKQFVDLLDLAICMGVSDLNVISLAARELAAELGQVVRLESKMWGVILWFRRPA